MDFGTVLIVIAVIAVLVAVGSYWGTGRIYSGLGREGGLDMTRERRRRRPPAGAEVQEEIRQMLEAKSRAAPGARRARARRGRRAGDAHPSPRPRPIPRLREEIRQLVIARNERRLRQGKEPLDVEAEIERQLRVARG